jgi:flagellin-like protein
MKGISAIVATLLLLMITMGLAVTAYFYINNIITGRTSKTLTILDASCSGTTITLVLANDGTQNVADNEIRVVIDSADRSANFDFAPDPIIPRNTGIASHSAPYASGTHQVLVAGPGSSSKVTVLC